MSFEPTEFEWRQPKATERAYELTSGEKEFGRLRFEKSSGSLASGSTGNHHWTFKRSGFLSPRVTVRESGSEIDLASFVPTWTGSGWLQFSSGKRYHLRSTNFWSTEWSFEDESGNRVVSLTGPHGLFKHGGHAAVASSFTGQPETLVMLLLIWYLRVLMNEDASAVAVIATVG